MGWHISLLKNEVKITNKKCAEELKKLRERDYGPMGIEDVCYDGWIVFNPDDMEWMDYLSDSKFLNVLKKYKVKGDICFGSEEGDNAGEYWGYRFDGEGECKKLVGNIVWNEE